MSEATRRAIRNLKEMKLAELDCFAESFVPFVGRRLLCPRGAGFAAAKSYGSMNSIGFDARWSIAGSAPTNFDAAN